MSNNNTNRITEFARESGKAGAGIVTGGLVGLLAAWYGRFQADAAVRVRPGLAEVGFIEATVTNHPTDWLFYHYPDATGVVVILLFGLIGAYVGSKL